MALIGIDARLLSYRRGIGNFVYNLLTELAKIPGDERYILYVDDDRAKEFAPQNPRFTVKNIGVKIYPLWEQISLPLTVGSDGLDILHCPANTAPLFLPKRPNLILTIHDVMYLLPSSVLPKASSFYQRAGRIYYCKISPLAAKRAVRIMTISGKSKMDIIENLHIEPNKIQVVYLAGNAICQRIDDNDIVSKVMRQFAITGRYVFALGALDPRKNTENILRSFARMKQLSPLPIQLVLAGLSAEAQKIFHSFISKLGLNGKVILLGFVTELELTALYNGADVFFVSISVRRFWHACYRIIRMWNTRCHFIHRLNT